MIVFTYSDADLMFELSDTGSKFDQVLQREWNDKMNQGNVFRYQFSVPSERNIGNQFLLQLNANRAELRRPPASLHSMNEPFNPNGFNFNKVKDQEKVFKLVRVAHNAEETCDNYVIVNVSPLEYGHVLLVPSSEKCYPQVLTEDALKLAVEFSLLSGSTFFRVGVNSLGAHATVNHLHFHCYYLEHQMFLETAIVEEIAYPCHKILNYPGKGFAFQIRNKEDIVFIVKKIFSLVSLLQIKNIPHNLYFTRGLDFETAKSLNVDKSSRNCLRIYVWARKPTWGAKELSAFNIATCELFGHMVIKNEPDFNSLTQDDIVAALHNLTDEPFRTVIPDVEKLFSQ